MLVVPALISLKPSIIDKVSAEATELITRVVKRLRDPQDIVAKTARKLLLELQKCYPTQFESQLVNSLKSEDDKIICRAVLRNDEDEIQRLLTSIPSQPVPASNGPTSRRGDEAKQSNGYASGASGKAGAYSGSGKELSIIGKEILQSNP